jgi:S-adenosylmethionine synthetase
MQKLSENEFLFTSESVTEGHPDKVCDQISDGVLDAVMAEDPTGRVACECLVNTGLVVVSGEITTETYVDIPSIARETIRKIGYDDPRYGFDHKACAVLTRSTSSPRTSPRAWTRGSSSARATARTSSTRRAPATRE